MDKSAPLNHRKQGAGNGAFHRSKTFGLWNRALSVTLRLKVRASPKQKTSIVFLEEEVGLLNTVAAPAALGGDSRGRRVESARQQWIGKLIDVSRRNNLLYFRVLKTGTLDLSQAPVNELARLFSGDTVPIAKLFSAEQQAASLTVREIARRALNNEEEKGLETLFVTLGIATWPADDGGRPIEAPLLLLPIKVASQGRSANSFSLARTGTAQINLVLLHVLDAEYGIRMNAEELIPLLRGDDEGEEFDPRPLFEEVTRTIDGRVQGFELRNAIYVGNFAFQKMAMVRDLRERGAELAAHDLVAAIAGDSGARGAVSGSSADIDPKELDRVPPDNEFLVLDADSSQQAAIASIVKGENAVVHGPPGTGKSQTIVNLIANLTATGKRVLFVAEKRAALEVVQRRLRDVGLDHLAIDLHGADVAPKRVMEQVARALDRVRGSVGVDCAAVHGLLCDRRLRLNAHVKRMHQVRPPSQKSVYQLQGFVIRATDVTAKTRWRGAELARLTPTEISKARDLLKEAIGFAELFLRTDPSPWCGARLPEGSTAVSALDVVARLQSIELQPFLAAAHAITKAIGATALTSMKELRALLVLVDETQRTLSAYRDGIYARDPAETALRLAPAAHGIIQVLWSWLSDSGFRTARQLMIELRKAGKTSISELRRDAEIAAEQLMRWRKAGLSTLPTIIDDYDQFLRNFNAFWPDYDRLKNYIRQNPDDFTLDEFLSLVQRLAADSKTPLVIPKVSAIERGLSEAGVSALISELRSARAEPTKWVSMLDLAWYGSTLDDAYQRDPDLAGFHGATHNGFVGDFVEADEERIDLAAARVRRAHAERAITAMNAHSDQQMLIRGESQKMRRHLPLRKLFAQASDVLTALCPCWMASPLSVSQLLDGGKRYFDYVIFDEASQVLPEDAVCAILRGERVVVAGDRNQLPPTTFFAAATDDELAQDESDASDGYESLLDLMNGFLPSKYLSWHYRSKDEALIAFSNHFIYDDRLVTFPGPGGTPVISHAVVDQQLGLDGQEESCGAEVQRVVDLVIDHAKKRPDETLGVITMGIRHRDRVQRAIDSALDNHANLDEFFDQSRSERFFIKNLEAVQGDERDAIIISIGYGKDRAGNLPFRFGPLLPEGGRRRLNVAVTRARKRLTLVSSFSHLDMDLSRVRPGTGVELLRHYLEYAHSNGKLLGTSYLTSVPMNDFEQDICDALSSRGLHLIPQLGASHFRIDLVAEHPDKPGRYVLAIECDGATYHSSNTARDRDRLRQSQLEALGWRFHRIWSTDWFMRKADEVERALNAFKAAVAFADELDATRTQGNGPNGQHRPTQAANTQPKANDRTSRPYFAPGQPITAYTHGQLTQIIKWIASDGLMRTDEELLQEAVEILKFKRRGARIDAALRLAIKNSR